jgi:hypothetical protein
VSSILAPPLLEMIFSTNFMVDLKAEGGGVQLKVTTQISTS